MKNQKKKRGGSVRNRDRQKYLKILALPLVVMILILVIVLADRWAGFAGNSAEEASIRTEETESMAETDTGAEAPADGEDGEPSGTEPDSEEAAADQENGETAEEADSELKHNDIPEITALMEEYCRAKTDCDAETMYQLYGKTDMTGTEELRQRMQYRAKYVEAIENVDCYTLPGMEDNTYIVYVTADIKFRVTETLAPTIMWCYVRMEDDGTYHIVENITAEEAEYAAKAEQSEAVRRLAAQVNEELEVAISADTRLASAYGMLKEGTTVPDSAQTAQTSAAQTEAQTQAETGGEAAAQ